MNRKALFFLVLLSLTNLGRSQEIAIRGIVVDAATQRGVGNAEITVDATE